MRMSNESILVILFVGLIAGWLAGQIVRGTGFGIIGDILVGIAGALVASLLFPRLGISIGTGLVREIIFSAIGAIILLFVVGLLFRGGRRYWAAAAGRAFFRNHGLKNNGAVSKDGPISFAPCRAMVFDDP